MPTLKNEIVMTVTKELDCINVVEMTPKPRLFQSLSVLLRNIFSKVPPVKP